MVEKDAESERERQTPLMRILSQQRDFRALARDSGISRRMLDRYKAGMEPSLSVAAKIARALNLSIDALVGDGYDRFSDAYVAPVATDMVRIPRFSIQASAGHGAVAIGFEEAEAIDLPASFFRRLGVSPRSVEVLTGRGDSMYPTIIDGHPLLIDRAQAELLGGGVYVFSIGEDVRLKRLERRIDGGLIIISDNADVYPREELSRQDMSALGFKIHGRLIWTEKTL